MYQPQCGTACGHTTLNVCGSDTEVHYFHTHRDGVDLVFVSHPCFYQVADGIYQGSNMDVTWRGALLSQAGKELSQSPRTAGRDCPYSYQKGRLTSALTVCPYIAIYQTDIFFFIVPGIEAVYNVPCGGFPYGDERYGLGRFPNPASTFYLSAGDCLSIHRDTQD